MPIVRRANTTVVPPVAAPAPAPEPRSTARAKRPTPKKPAKKPALKTPAKAKAPVKKKTPAKKPASKSRHSKATVIAAARAQKPPKKAKASEPHKVVAPKRQAPKKASKGNAPKAGEIVAFSEGAIHNPMAMWFKVVNVTFKRASGETGTIDWLCTAPEALSAAAGDPFKVKYASMATYQPKPEGHVIELPALLES